MRRKGSLKRPRRFARPRNGPGHRRQAVHHALRRLGERYGLALDVATYEALCAAVRLTFDASGGSTLGGRCIYRESRRSTWHLLRIDGQPVLAVYDSRVERIVTFLELRPALATIGLRLEDVA